MDQEHTDEDRLADYCQMMGPLVGKLAYVLDGLTDVIALIGQHKVYCRVEKGPRAGLGTRDVEAALERLEDCKSHLRESLAALRAAPGGGFSAEKAE